MRSVVLALEAYVLDNKRAPPDANDPDAGALLRSLNFESETG
jgi:hypothetical protein